MSKQRRSSRTTPSSVSKGRMLEQIVASMHEHKGVVIQRNVKLPPAHRKGLKREIDVLLSSEVCGYPVRWAIECKNETKKSGALYIDAFVGKLTYLGIPPQFGIFVSVGGYTQGAIDHANAAGIKLLLYEDGLRELDAALAQAVQTIVYLLPIVQTFTIQNFVSHPMNAGDMQLFYDSDGNACNALPNVIWQMWLDNGIPSTIGERSVIFDYESLKGIYQRSGDRLAPVTRIEIQVQVIGIVQQLIGSVSADLLRDMPTGNVEREQIKAQFAAPSPGKYSLRTITSEKQLEEEFPQDGLVKIMVRFRLPRINYRHISYWPPSDRVVGLVAERMRAFEAGQIPDPRPFNISELEGHELATVFEPFGSSR